MRAVPGGGRPALAWAVAAAAMALLVVRSWRIDYPYSIDFQTYWLAGSRLLHGEASKLYDAGGGDADGTPAAMAAGEFKNVPLVAVPFAPLALLPYADAKRVFWWISLASVVATAVIAGRSLLPEALGPPAERILWSVALLAAMAPTHVALRHGQTTPLVALALAGFLACASSGREVGAGALLGLACLVKFAPVALLALLAARRRFAALGAAAAVIVVAAGVSLAAFGPALHRPYVAGIAENAGRVIPGHNNQSIAAAANRVLLGAKTNDWTPVPIPRPVRSASIALGLGLLALVAGTVVLSRSFALEALAAIAFGVVALPVAWDHYVVLIAPFLLAASGSLRGAAVPSIVALALLGLPTPEPLLDAPQVAAGIPGLVVSHVFLGVALLIGVAFVRARRA